VIELRFEGLSRHESVSLGPAHIRQGPDGAVVAQIAKHQWSVGERFTRLYVVDGAVRGREDARQVAEETQLWHCFPTETDWPVLVLEPNPPA
jgi:hypothetical protein